MQKINPVEARQGRWGQRVLVVLVAALILAVIAGAALLLASSVINRLLGYEFTRGLEKITAVIVSFIALEMIMSGIKTYFFAGS